MSQSSEVSSLNQFFSEGFKALTGNTPFKWQSRLFSDYFVPLNIPSSIHIPTGLGKTSVIVIWLLALAYQISKNQHLLPRRLIYVVNRRTVVDQSTKVAEELRDILQNVGGSEGKSFCFDLHRHLSSLCVNQVNQEFPPLAISTLRGELADNQEWQTDPSRPTIIIGTVDMIGSRLLFSGYGVSKRMRPFHAGLLGQNALVIHDEAHLTPAFGRLVKSIVERQESELFPLRLLELSATLREEDASRSNSNFCLKENEEEEKEVKKRIFASKSLILCKEVEENKIAEEISKRALEKGQNKRVRVLIYVTKPKVATDVAKKIAKEAGKDCVKVLTGTLRGYERDELADTPLFKGFQARPLRESPEHSEYLVSTSAGEVGVDLDADQMICEITTLDSMIQRLGRLNRLGGYKESEVLLVRAKPKEMKKTLDSDEKKKSEKDDYISRVALTWELFKSELLDIPDGKKDVSSKSLQNLLSKDGERCKEAFSPTPVIEPLTDILIDNWSMTRATDLPGRLPVSRWLHGVSGFDPSLYVAWREEINHFNRENSEKLKELFSKHRILSRERLRGNLKRDVVSELKKISKRDEDVKAVLIPVTGAPEYGSLNDILDKSENSPESTIVLSPDAGGLNKNGMLDGKEKEKVSDKADFFSSDISESSQRFERERLRVLVEWSSDTEEWEAKSLSSDVDLSDISEAVADSENLGEVENMIRDKIPMAQKSSLVLGEDEEGNPTKALMLFSGLKSVEVVQESPATAAGWQELEEHLAWAKEEAENIVEKLKVDSISGELENIGDAIVIAAQWHDCGKNRVAWQKAIGHPPPVNGGESTDRWKPWAKSGKRGFDRSKCRNYRHEFGSLREAGNDKNIKRHPEKDLILHLIASHHGWSRPHFKANQDIIESVTEDQNNVVSFEAMRRFARLQRRFGHWGLAWLEAILRSADYAASRKVGQK